MLAKRRNGLEATALVCRYNRFMVDAITEKKLMIDNDTVLYLYSRQLFSRQAIILPIEGGEIRYNEVAASQLLSNNSMTLTKYPQIAITC